MKQPTGRQLGRRLLQKDPLTADDWAEVYTLYRAFQDGLARIAARARERGAKGQPIKRGEVAARH
jgi:hypothetical protein